MNGNMVFIVFAWIFFLICGGVMMVGTYLIFSRKQTDPKQQDPSAPENKKIAT